MDDTFPGVSRMHFQVHDDQKGQLWCGPSEGRVPQCQDGVCLLASVKHFYGKVLADEGRAIEYPAMDYDKVEPGVWFSDADAVKMLLNLLGDLHQPLHVGFASDDSGKALRALSGRRGELGARRRRSGSAEVESDVQGRPSACATESCGCAGSSSGCAGGYSGCERESYTLPSFAPPSAIGHCVAECFGVAVAPRIAAGHGSVED